MRTWALGIFVAASLALPLAAAAANDKKEDVERVVSADNKAAFDEQAAMVRKQMAEHGRYEFVTPAERTTVEKRLDEIGDILQRNQGQATLADDAKTSLYVAQEDINAILTRRDGRRVICEHVGKTGSHRKHKECTTYGEREIARRESEQYMRESNRKTVCLGKECDPAIGNNFGRSPLDKR